MKTFSRDDDNNIIIENGKIKTVEGLESTNQRVSNSILMNKGDNFLDLSEGIDYIGTRMTKDMYLTDAINRILVVEDVVSINSIDLVKDGNVMNLELNLETVDGELGI